MAKQLSLFKKKPDPPLWEPSDNLKCLLALGEPVERAASAHRKLKEQEEFHCVCSQKLWRIGDGWIECVCGRRFVMKMEISPGKFVKVREDLRS